MQLKGPRVPPAAPAPAAGPSAAWWLPGSPGRSLDMSPRAPARSTELGWSSRAASSCLPRVLPGTGESSTAQRLFKSGSKHEYLRAVNQPGASLALAPLLLPLGPGTPRVQPGNSSGGSGAPVQAGSCKCGESCGNLSLHEVNPKLGQTPALQGELPVGSVAAGAEDGQADTVPGGQQLPAALQRDLVPSGRVLVSPRCRKLIILVVNN